MGSKVLVDIPGNDTTTEIVTVGSSTTNVLELAGDHDWFKINLMSGQAITVALDALGTNPTLDTYLIIRDSSGSVLYEDDDIHTGVDTDSLLSFAASYSGVFYIDVGAFEDDSAGDYQLTVTAFQEPPVGTTDQIAEQLVSGYWGDGEHPFNVSPGGTITVNLTGLTTAGQNLARTALQQWSEITGLNFSEVTGTAQINFSDETGPTDGGAWTELFYDANDHYTTEAYVNIDVAWLSTYGAQVGSYSYHAYLHEIGHALGLGHAGNYNAVPANYPYDALYLNDSWSTSIMSYFNQEQSEYFDDLGFTYLNLVTPMVADIVAIQQLYGLSTTTRSGNTTYGFNSNAGNQIYNANVSTGGITNVALTIFDTGGIDTLDYSGSSAVQRIDLTPESFSNVLGQTGNLSIARGTIIENAIGGSGSDVIIGNGANNILIGGAGADRISGFGGVDHLFGGDGNDMLLGGSGIDILEGGSGDDTYRVDEAGDRILEAIGFGRDTVLATVSYALETGVEVEKLRVLNEANTLSINLTGNDFGQAIVGNAGTNVLRGLGGKDTLYGLAGNDTLVGGAGNDLLKGGSGDDTYRVDDALDRVLESVGFGSDTILATLTYTLRTGSEIEKLRVLNETSINSINLSGNEFSQAITGNAGVNVLRGLGGNDKLYGLGGNDTLIGHQGNDTLVGGAGDNLLTGGTGADMFSFVSLGVNDTITDFEVGSDKIDLRSLDANTQIGGDQAFTWIGTGTFTNTAGQLRTYEDAGIRYVAGDVNGDGIADFIINVGSINVGSTDILL